MAKKTAIIDLGSNGIRMAIYEKTSRYGFYILNEQKVKFRLAQGAYEQDNVLVEKQIKKAYEIIKYFKTQALNFKCNKIFCIGTSALRDAKNKADLINLLKKDLKLNIKTLSGMEEAYLSGFGAINLLPKLDEKSICLDIGGGSAELCLCENTKVVKTFSLDLGTVRLKDLFKDKFNKLEKYIDNYLEQIPDDFKASILITIGGSLRAISNAIMEKNNYPLSQVHAFSYQVDEESEFIEKIINCKNSELSSLGIKKERHDTIKMGALVFYKIIKKLKIKQIITSGAGVREGIFLKDLFKHHKGFPVNFNPSLKSLEDRLIKYKSGSLVSNVTRLFNTLNEIHYVDKKYLKHLTYAAKLIETGLLLSYYSNHKHSAYCVLSGLNFCIKHEDKALIATIIEQHGKKINYENLKLKKLLPDENTISWLNFILAFCNALNKAKENEICDFSYKNKTLYITKNTNNFIMQEAIKKISKPKSFNVYINNEEI
ncbi:Ppx/GppA phosphatase family protein [Campylobacter sp. RM12637]|uniref:Ppx/GppA phosphatase family protein n=1 Tax=Campylobacter sp. RM12637 TaxID=2735734 RepID=UPI003014E678|nr:Ppx/GppA family phosphatase [Campylobacter sp. RM12637]